MLIGTFSKYVKTTVKTLRYYDRIGLFCPYQTDLTTGYRHYTIEQLSEFEQIRKYRAAGLSVEQIKRLLAGENRELILKEHQFELVKQENLLYRQKEALFDLLNNQTTNAYTVQLKQLPSYTVCSCRTCVVDTAHIAPVISQKVNEMKHLYPNLAFASPNYCCVTFTDTSHRDTDIEIEYCEAVISSQQNKNGFIFKTLAGCTFACIEHRGPYESISAAYAALLRWITTSNYQISGPVRERFIHGAWDSSSVANWLTEIQVPVRKQDVN